MPPSPRRCSPGSSCPPICRESRFVGHGEEGRACEGIGVDKRCGCGRGYRWDTLGIQWNDRIHHDQSCSALAQNKRTLNAENKFTSFVNKP